MPRVCQLTPSPSAVLNTGFESRFRHPLKPLTRSENALSALVCFPAWHENVRDDGGSTAPATATPRRYAGVGSDTANTSCFVCTGTTSPSRAGPRANPRDAAPDRAVRKQRLVAPLIAFHQFVPRHAFRTKHDMGGVVQTPIAVKNAILLCQLSEQRRVRIGRQDVEHRAGQAVLLNPVDRGPKNVRPVVVESKYEATVDLDSMIVKETYSTRVVVGPGALLSLLTNVGVVQRFKAHEDARAPGQGHFPNGCRIVCHVDRNRRTPDSFQRPEHRQSCRRYFGFSNQDCCP